MEQPYYERPRGQQLLDFLRFRNITPKMEKDRIRKHLEERGRTEPDFDASKRKLAFLAATKTVSLWKKGSKVSDEKEYLLFVILDVEDRHALNQELRQFQHETKAVNFPGENVPALQSKGLVQDFVLLRILPAIDQQVREVPDADREEAEHFRDGILLQATQTDRAIFAANSYLKKTRKRRRK